MKTHSVLYIKLKQQAEIKLKYAERIEQYEIEYCEKCINYIEHVWFMNKWSCKRDLIPCTSTGDPCPYSTARRILTTTH